LPDKLNRKSRKDNIDEIDVKKKNVYICMLMAEWFTKFLLVQLLEICVPTTDSDKNFGGNI